MYGIKIGIKIKIYLFFKHIKIHKMHILKKKLKMGTLTAFMKEIVKIKYSKIPCSSSESFYGQEIFF